MKNYRKHFLSYSKKERTGIFVLVGLIIATITIPSLVPPPVMEADKAAFEKLRAQLAKLESDNSPQDETSKSREGLAGHHEEPASAARSGGRLFPFDPNTLAVEGWIQLGVRARTAATIQRYLAKGGRFRAVTDIYKIYGLKKEEADRLVPYVRIPVGTNMDRFAGSEMVAGLPAGKTRGEGNRGTSGTGGRGAFRDGRGSGQDLSYGRYTKPSGTPVIDINTADTTAFIALRGIGPALAGRIVRFREKLGGFHRMEQVGETYGLPDSTFISITPYLQCISPVLRTIDINNASFEALDAHPYISRQQAGAIVRYREQHGPYQSVDQLLQITILSPEGLDKIRPYLSVR
ncbi:helix-hairpin-helix domain-containing protein [Paraflavitalea sp. CAU 1676]|uniref:helix-hairpin-helix domain-containing protein n=1 Tax=Paraflavitalea sp. CAU 1676 TaxID=3032598 RepID=UPI0023DB5070|nr:helix-hairpin-helix domain-containing protein [Paraflavitalea sp. CAU 1676]MDF2187396.1 helix-hairpin-helix domain-containing protein [Paraflavitalea sp. CAU 1676]